MNEAIRLYGTEVPPVASEVLTVGALSFTLEEGALRHVCVDGVEVIRGIAFLVRDRDWGTLTPALSVVSREGGADALSLNLKAVFETHDARLDVTLVLNAGPDALTLQAEGVATGDFETNRSGFTVLHPADLAGCPVSVVHSDGSVEESVFPTLIDPWQPFMDIVSITHRADGLAVRCAFEGDIFEMEDQRQWGDASYKTYVRPLALPWPYTLKDGERFSQSVMVSWRMTSAPATKREQNFTPGTVKFPETALLVSACDAERLAGRTEDIARVSPQRLLCHVDTSIGSHAAQLGAFAKLQSAMPELVYDLELVCGFDQPPAAELCDVRSAMDAAGFKPQSVMVCPAVDRQSTPPGSEWPSCPPLNEIHQASRTAFGDLACGGGMASFFPELNRKRPPVGMLDFVTHGLCPIIHAADDLSVMETLEAIPHITRTARSITGDIGYRIGPSTIALRHNPYGQKTMPNPDLGRVCMTHDDPRHRAQFGAAFAVGLACALAPSGVDVWTPSEVYGPRGLHEPLDEVLALLASLAGEPVHNATIQNGLAVLTVGQRRITANLTAQTQGNLSPFVVNISPA
ncbi:hypothetical protein [Antarctobacter jejuensis]|uniref:hypothetical protein n=1 Tax=Antarctobacter jejuensis TaxID=1439938 RepID=UPI003FD2522E